MPEAQPREFEIGARSGGTLRGLYYESKEADASLPTALCIHGFSADANSMHWVASALNRSGMNAVVPDMRAHGLSDSTRTRIVGPNRLSKEVAEICEKLDLRRIIVVTQSFGGWIGLRLLQDHPPDLEIEGFHAFAPNWFMEPRPWREIREWLPRSRRILWRLGRTNGFLSRRKPTRIDYDRYAGTPDFHPPRMREEVSAMSWPSYAVLFSRIQWLRHGWCPDWTSLSPLPVQIMAARHDKLVENTELEGIADRTGWPLGWIECGHVGVSTEKVHGDAFAQSILATQPTA